MPEIKKGYQGPLYNPWYDWAKKYASSYAFMLGSRDGYVGAQEDAFIREMQRRGGLVIDGIFGDRTAARFGYVWPGSTSPPVVVARRKIWIDSSPGSGGNWDQGPSFELGERCKRDLNLNHQPEGFQKGGYLGLMGGPSDLSYVEVTWDQCKSIEWLWDNRSDAQEALAKAGQYALAHGFTNLDTIPDSFLVEIASQLEYENHISGYSQSADGAEDAMEYLLGDPGFIHPGDASQTPSRGKYRLLRHCLKRVVQFGNPSTKSTGIARKKRPAWLDAKIRNVNYENDFYAVALDAIRPAFYAIIIKAESEIPFGVRVVKIAIPIILDWAAKILPFVGTLLGGTPFGPLTQTVLGMIPALSGIGSNPILGGLISQAASSADDEVDQKIIAMLELNGLLTNIPGLIQLVMALPGLQAHGNYPFDQVMMQKAFDHIASFRR